MKSNDGYKVMEFNNEVQKGILYKIVEQTMVYEEEIG